VLIFKKPDRTSGFETPNVLRGKQWAGGIPIPSRLGVLGERRGTPNGFQGGVPSGRFQGKLVGAAFPLLKSWRNAWKRRSRCYYGEGVMGTVLFNRLFAYQWCLL